MTKINITLIVTVSTVILIALFDIWAYLHGGVQLTISNLIWNSSHDHPVIPFAFGVLAGHLFWSE